jgi:hypothetical protein
MSITTFITDIKAKFFGSNKPKPTIAKITPIFDTEYMPDLEAGEGGSFYKRLRQRDAALELYSKTMNCDLEKADRTIICSEVAIDVNNGYEKCKIIENYVSFMDILNYLSTPITERGEFPFIMDDKIPSSEPGVSSFIDSDINDYTDLPLHLCSRNIL